MTQQKDIISVKEARKLLGKESGKLSDDEVTTIINDLDWLARMAIKDYLKQNTVNKAKK